MAGCDVTFGRESKQSRKYILVSKKMNFTLIFVLDMYRNIKINIDKYMISKYSDLINVDNCMFLHKYRLNTVAMT